MHQKIFGRNDSRVNSRLITCEVSSYRADIRGDFNNPSSLQISLPSQLGIPSSNTVLLTVISISDSLLLNHEQGELTPVMEGDLERYQIDRTCKEILNAGSSHQFKSATKTSSNTVKIFCLKQINRDEDDPSLTL